MNAIVNKLLLSGDEFIPEMHLRQPGFTYSACRPFTKKKERIEKFKETGDLRYIYQNDLSKACFQNDMAYMEILKICLEEQLKIKYYVINYLILLKIQNMMGINAELLQNFTKLLIKKLLVVLLTMNLCQNKNQVKNYTKQLLEYLKNEKNTLFYMQYLGC